MGAASVVSPYKGLSSFEEADAARFYGRGEETEELLACVRSGRLTTLFGRSGLGKTSILQAGLFPRLREEGYLPVTLRVGQQFQAGNGAGRSPVEILGAALDAQAAQWDVRVVDRQQGETLWEYFHRLPVRAPGHRTAIPVIVLDQFEELLEALPRSAGARAFLEELSDLVEDRVPERLRRSLEGGATSLPPRSRKPNVAVVLGLREDYLPQLEDLQVQMPSLFESRYRLLPLRGDQAYDAVYEPVREWGILEASVAAEIVRYVSAQGVGVGTSGRSLSLEGIECEPVLLSFVCDELMKRRGEGPISTRLLEGEQEDLLRGFYEQSFHTLGDKGFEPATSDALRTFVEDHLLTRDGRRTPYDLAEATKLDGVSRRALDALIDRHLLRRFDWQGNDLIELIHDRVAEIARESRDARLEREESERRRRKARAERERLEAQAKREREERERTAVLDRARVRRAYLLASVLFAGLLGLGLLVARLLAQGAKLEDQKLELGARNRRLSAARLTLLSQGFEEDPGLSFLLARRAASAQMEKHAATQLHRAMDLCSERRVLRGHDGPVLACAMQPTTPPSEPARLLTATRTTMRIWSWSGDEEFAFPAPNGEPVGLALSRNGEMCAGCWRSGDVLRFYVWGLGDAAASTLDGVAVEGVQDILAWGFARDRDPVVILSRRRPHADAIYALELGEGVETFLRDVSTIPEEGQSSVAPIRATVSSSGRFVAVFTDNDLQVFSVSGTREFTLQKNVWNAAFDSVAEDRLVMLHAGGISSLLLDEAGRIVGSLAPEELLADPRIGGFFHLSPIPNASVIELHDASLPPMMGYEPRDYLVGHRGPVRDVGISSDHRWAMSASDDGTARIWRAAPGELPGLHETSSVVVQAAWSPDAQRVAYLLQGADGKPETVRVMNAGGGVTDRIQSRWGPITRLAFRPGRPEVLLGSENGQICLWSLEKDALSIPAVNVQTGAIVDLAWGADGRWAIASTENGEIVVFDADTGARLGAYRGDGKKLPPLLLATSSAHPVLVCYQRPDPTAVEVEPAPEPYAPPVAAPAGEPAASGTAPAPAAPIEPVEALVGPLLLPLPGLERAEEVQLEGHGHPVHQAVFDREGRRLVTLSTDRLRTWTVGLVPKDVRLDVDEDIEGQDVVGAWFSPGGLRLLRQPRGSDSLLVDREGRVLAELRTHRVVSGVEAWRSVPLPCGGPDMGVKGRVGSQIAVTPGGELLVSQLPTNSVAVADFQGRTLFTLPSPPGCSGPARLDFLPSPDSRVLLILHAGHVRSWLMQPDDLLKEAASYLDRDITEREEALIATSLPDGGARAGPDATDGGTP